MASTRPRTCSFLFSREARSRGQGIVALSQCTILFLQLRDLGGEFVDPGFQTGELEIELRIHWGAHGIDYRHNP